jgi:hypothetical protein
MHPSPMPPRSTRARRARGRIALATLGIAITPWLAACGKPSDAAPATQANAVTGAPGDSATAEDSNRRSQVLSVLRHAREIADSSRAAAVAASPPAWAAPPGGPAPAASAELRIASSLPSGASITVDGIEGELHAGRRLSLPASLYTLTLRVPGKAPVTGRVALSAGRPMTWPTGVEIAKLRDTAADPASMVASGNPPAATPVRDTSRALGAVPPPVDRAPDTRSGGGATKAATTDNTAASSEEIGGLLRRYAAAYEARKMEDVTRLFPSMTSDEKSRWGAFLESRDIQELHAQIAGMQPPDVEGNTALVNFTLALDYKMTGAGRQTPRFNYKAMLKRDATGGWTLLKLDTR